MNVPVVAFGRGSPSVLREQAETEEPPDTMIGLYDGSASGEPAVPRSVQWVPLAERAGRCGTGATAGVRNSGGIENLHRQLSSDVVFVSARVGGRFGWAECERLFRELRGDGRLLLGVLAGPYSEEKTAGGSSRARVRAIPDFFLPVNTASVVAALERSTSSPDPDPGVSQFLAGVVRTLRGRLRRSERLAEGLRGLLEMTPREKLALLKIRMGRLLRDDLPNSPS